MKKMLKKGFAFLCGVFVLVGIASMQANAQLSPIDPGPDPTNQYYIEYKGIETIYMDENGDFIFQTLDKQKSSTLFYRTIGFELSRIRRGVTDPENEPDPYYGGKNNRQKILIDLGDEKVDDVDYRYIASNGKTYIVTNKTFTYQYMVEELIQSQYPDWYTEIHEMEENGEPIFIGCDGVLAIGHDIVNEKKEVLDTWLEGHIRNGKIVGNCYTYNNYSSLIRKFPASLSSKIESHYNKFFALNGEPVPGNPGGGNQTEDVYENYVPTEGTYRFIKSKAEGNPADNSVYAQSGVNPNLSKSNLSGSYSAPVTSVCNIDPTNTYDIGKAIPASGTYQNTVAASRWYGYFTIDKNSIDEADLKKKYKYSIKYKKAYEANYSGSLDGTKDLENFTETSRDTGVTGTYTVEKFKERKAFEGKKVDAEKLRDFKAERTYQQRVGDKVYYFVKGTYAVYETETKEYTGSEDEAPEGFVKKGDVITVKGTYTAYKEETLSGSVEYLIGEDPDNEYNYYTLGYLGLYQLDKMEAISEGVTTDYTLHDIIYSDVKQTIPYTIKKNGVSWNQTVKKSASDVAYTATDTTAVLSGETYNVYAKYKGHVYLPVCDESDFKPDTVYSDKEAAVAARNAETENRSSGKTAKIYNDEFSLNGKSYLTNKGMAVDSSVLSQAATSGGYEIESETKKTDIIERTTDCVVDLTTPNDDFFETLKTTYSSFVFKKGIYKSEVDGSSGTSKTFVLKDTPGSIPAIRAGYERYEPIKVFSPVISPIHIDDTYSTKQQVSQVGLGPVLNPDMNYTVVFDWNNYFELKYGKGYTINDKAGWLKFVQKKEVSFPCSVKYNGVIYEPDETGYTPYIELKPEHWESFPIYLPSWTEEGVYQNGDGIKVRAYANNYVESMQDEAFEKVNTNETVADQPLNRQYYVATYTYPIQVVGVMYDFVVNDINDSAGYGGNEEDYNITSRLIERHEEKYVGVYNRFNVLQNSNLHKWRSTLYRCLLDGETPYKRYEVPNLNTLPLQRGKTSFNIYDGCVPLGYTIAFQCKTLGSAGDQYSISGKDYSIFVNPTYRYVAKDGTVLQNTESKEQLRLFYMEGEKFFRFDENSPQTDYPARKIQIGSEYHNFSYDDNDLLLNGEIRRLENPWSVIWKETTKGQTPRWIYLSSKNMLYMPDEMELRVNEAAPYSGIPVKRYNAELDTLTESQQDQFNRSMQTWYGEYTIPNSTLVMDVAAFRKYYRQKLTPGGNDWDLYKEIARQYGIYYADITDLDAKITTDVLYRWACEEGFTLTEPYWLTEGYLVLNFDISLFQGETKYLSYYKEYDMWAGEAGTWKATGETGEYSLEHTRKTTVEDYWNNSTDIDLYSGDVAIIDISKKMSDHRQASVWLID